jgi:sugar lactone lactonase YvrE
MFAVAWSPDGREVWTAGNPRVWGGVNSLVAVDMSGRHRVIAPTSGVVELIDVARDGAALALRHDMRTALMARAPGEARERDLSWLDGSMVTDLSGDGRTVLFVEQNEGGGAPWSAYMRGTDGSPPVRLGDGVPQALSPDGRFVLWHSKDAAGKLALMPTAAGEVRELPLQPFVESCCLHADWTPAGNMFINAREQDGRCRIYQLSADGRARRPVTPVGTKFRSSAVSPDERFVAIHALDSPLMNYPVDGGAPQVVGGAGPTDDAVQWSADGRALYVVASGQRQWIDRIDLATGGRTRWRTLEVSDRPGLPVIMEVRMTRDGSAYAYSYQRWLTDAFVVTGLR